MRSLARALAVGTMLAFCATPAWAQDDEAPAEEPAEPSRVEEADPTDEAPPTEASDDTSDSEAAAAEAEAKAARRARIRAARAARRQAALERAAAARAEAEAEARAAAATESAAAAKAPEPKPADEAPPTATVTTARHDVRPADTTPAAATHEAKPLAPPVEHTAPVHAPAAAEHGAQTAAAEHGPEHAQHSKFQVTTFIWQLINFGTLLFLLIYFGGRRLNQWLRGRHEQLKNEIGDATRLRDEAKRKFDAQERRLADLEKEISALRASMRKDAEAEQARMLEAAQERARRMQDDMRAQVDEQVKVAEAALRAEIASVSVKLAAEMVRTAMSFEDERRLAREFVAGFGQSGTTDEEAR